MPNPELLSPGYAPVCCFKPGLRRFQREELPLRAWPSLLSCAAPVGWRLGEGGRALGTARHGRQMSDDDGAFSDVSGLGEEEDEDWRDFDLFEDPDSDPERFYQEEGEGLPEASDQQGSGNSAFAQHQGHDQTPTKTSARKVWLRVFQDE